MSSAQVACLREWILQVTHPCQFAVHKGAQKAVSLMNRHAESVLARACETWAVSYDLTKMFNLLATKIAMGAAKYMGLAESNCEEISSIIDNCKGSWRLPGNVATPTFSRERGLPQGMASSVAMAELCVAIILWRIQRAVATAVVAYVDDLNFIAQSRRDLVRILELVEEFTVDFGLVIARHKTFLWGTNIPALKELGEEWNLSVTTTLTSLGVEWGLCPSERPSYSKEKKRLHEAAERMRRIAHLSLPILEKAKILVTGCLSLLEYSPIPIVSQVTSLRSGVRRALGQMYGSSEVLFEVVHKCSVDPLSRWFVSACRLFADWRRDDPATLGKVHLARRNSRIATLCKVANSLGWTITLDAVKFNDGSGLAWDRPWDEFRNIILNRFRRSRLRTLSLRRGLYEGLTDLDVQQHTQLLGLLSPHSASIMLRVWCGCAMTGSWRARMDPMTSPACPCGAPCQDIEHLVYHCEMFQPASRTVREWGRRPPAYSSALLCPPFCTPREKQAWRETCQRAIKVSESRSPYF